MQNDLLRTILTILICLAAFAIAFLIQALAAFKAKSRIVKCLPLIPVALLLLFCVILLISCITTVNAPVEGDSSAQLGQGIGKAIILILTIAVCVPSGCIILGDAAAWITYAIVISKRRKAEKALPESSETDPGNS